MISSALSPERTPKKTPSIQEPLVIHYEEKSSITSCAQMPTTMTVEVLSPFAYKDSRVVPWRYECQFITNSVNFAAANGLLVVGDVIHQIT